MIQPYISVVPAAMHKSPQLCLQVVQGGFLSIGKCFFSLREAVTSNVWHDVQKPQESNQPHTNADKTAAFSGLGLIRSGSRGEVGKDREHLSQETSRGTDSALKGDDEGGITTSCCALDPPCSKDDEVSNVARTRERERARTSTLWIIVIQTTSQVSEAEGELGERVVRRYEYIMNLCTPMHHAIISARWNGAQSVAHQTLPA